MIVTCHSCQTRFRVADEKIGPKGARVRCSRCKTVFSVRLPASSAAAVAPSAHAELPSPHSAGEADRGVARPTAPADDPFARAAAAAPERTLPDLALEETERIAPSVHPSPEPSVASRSPGLLDFGEVDLAGPDAFGDTRQQAFGDFAPQEPAEPAPTASEDPLAGFSLDLGAPGEAAPPTSTLLPPPVEAPPLPEPAPPVDAPPVAAHSAPRAPPPDAEQDAAADAERSRKRLRAVGVNALSLVVLVALAVVLFQVWRGRQHADSAAGPRAAAVALDVSSGPYETASGKPVVVVRGRVQATERLRKAEVRVELVDGGRAVAAGTALAGAVPTVEEVHAVGSPADAAALADTIAPRAPAEIAAGEVLPFAAVVADPPPDLRAVEVRVSVRPQTLGNRQTP